MLGLHAARQAAMCFATSIHFLRGTGFSFGLCAAARSGDATGYMQWTRSTSTRLSGRLRAGMPSDLSVSICFPGRL